MQLPVMVTLVGIIVVMLASLCLSKNPRPAKIGTRALLPFDLVDLHCELSGRRTALRRHPQYRIDLPASNSFSDAGNVIRFFCSLDCSCPRSSWHICCIIMGRQTHIRR